MKNILITSVGQRVSLVRAFQNELKAIFPERKVFTLDLNPILAPACHISDGFAKIVRVTDKNYIFQLLKICKDWQIKIIIPTIDTELKILSENKDVFINEGIIPIVSHIDLVEKCRDKRKIEHFFKENGIEVPMSVDKNNPTFPLFIKPYDGSLSKDTFLINKNDELTEYHFSNKKLMFMEYIDPQFYDEYTIDAYYNKSNNLICAVPRKRIFVRAGEINKGVTKKNELLNYIKYSLSHIDGAIGCLTIQFFLNKINNRAVAIEINPRFGGGYPLSYLAGANFPKYIIQEYILNENIDSYIEDWEKNLLMLRYDDEILLKNYEE